MATQESRTFKARCHCNAVQLSFSVPSSALPLSAHTCHCKICQHIHGTLAYFGAKLPSNPTPNPGDIKALKSYRALPHSDVVRYFCSVCGTQMIGLAEDDKTWFIATSTVEGGDETVFEFSDAIYVPHSIDGGLSDWLGPKTKKWDTWVGVGDPLENDAWKKATAQAETTKEETLNVYCQCKGVSLTVHRPDYHSEAFKNDFSDMVLPPEEASERNIEQERKDGTWWVAIDQSKYKAGTCFCASCRLSAGCEQMQWAFVPLTFITLPDGSPYRNIFGTLKEYESSPDTFRRFCGTCGSLVFWHNLAKRPLIIDLAVGVMDSSSGSRAENWLEWRPAVSYADDAVNKKLAKDIQNGVREWHESMETKK